ncbi:GNAT family N-acetyltransferase [Nocardiopsis sp. N85]|uniref:GNAT family N-acetyltransferase n=1 Tax=Nocardiopsis sp. N85 TaxID=3029400 RepID=UPI00237F707F|nr:GNAT family N-acetyltransferase [Nocardiopsis sp. N85]MDE3722165.1 GNAT family N-acetyltransferase [Nocardiopsis sp. N85]
MRRGSPSAPWGRCRSHGAPHGGVPPGEEAAQRPHVAFSTRRSAPPGHRSRPGKPVADIGCGGQGGGVPHSGEESRWTSRPRAPWPGGRRWPATTAPLTVAAVPASGLCPPGWCGIVHLDGVTLATAPDPGTARTLRAALSVLPPGEHTDPGAVGRALTEVRFPGLDGSGVGPHPSTVGSCALAGPGAQVGPSGSAGPDASPVAAVLGPAVLAYLAPGDFLPAHHGAPVSTTGSGDPRIRGLLERVGPREAGESGLGGPGVPVSVLMEGDRAVAAAGYVRQGGRTAHLCVLTDTDRRGRGLARTVASAATARALAEGLLPQWRARPPASRAVAASLGYRTLGAQLSLRLARTPGPSPSEGGGTG